MIYGKYPAVIHSYNEAAKRCMIEIPGMTDGSYIEAELSFPLSDSSTHTSLRILEGDLCWIEFVGGDPKFPLITGFRPKNSGSVVDYRRFHHKHFETDADETQKHTAGTTYRIEAGTSATVIVGENTIVADTSKIVLTVGSSSIKIESGQITVSTPQFVGVQT